MELDLNCIVVSRISPLVFHSHLRGHNAWSIEVDEVAAALDRRLWATSEGIAELIALCWVVGLWISRSDLVILQWASLCFADPCFIV